MVASDGSKSKARTPAAELPAVAALSVLAACPALLTLAGFVSLQYSAWVGGNPVVASELHLGVGKAAGNLLVIADNPGQNLKIAENSALQE